MDFLKDLLTLDVVTVSGTIRIRKKATNTDSNAENIIDFNNIFDGDGKVKEDLDLKVIAATKINIDRDTYNFVAEDLGEQEKLLAELHFSSVDMAMKSRAEIVARIKPDFKRGDVAS